MLFLLVSALAMSTVLGHPFGPISKQMTYEKEDKSIMRSEESAQIMAVEDRSSNLKYVMAIKSSSIWAEIKKRSLTINTAQELNDTVAEKSPDNLSDQELAQLKQACHDGLKCVAVDQLLVLKQVKQPLGGGKVSVRTAITKITQVLTQYTTEYHEDVYQYEAVNDSDDESKVYKSVTTIVEDNKELCRIDLTPATQVSHPKNDKGNAVSAVVVNNNNTVNYNTSKNYNINNGTVNSATINIEPHSGDTKDERPKHKTLPVTSNAQAPTTGGQTKNVSINRSSDQHDVDADHQSTPLAKINSMSAAGDESVTNAPENNTEHKLVKENRALDSGTSDQHYEPVTTTNNHPEHARSTDHYPKTTEPATNNRTVLRHSNRNDASTQTVTKNTADDAVNNNTVELNNSSGDAADDKDDFYTDIVSAGSQNTHISNKGVVEDGFLNNGNMKVISTDNSNRNKGIIKDVNADNGIINVGTTNNGSVNYGTSNGYTNNGTILDTDHYDIRQYVNNIDKMYSTILHEFAKH